MTFNVASSLTVRYVLQVTLVLVNLAFVHGAESEKGEAFASKKRIDLGRVYPGEKIIGKAELQNSSQKETVKITELKKSCSCFSLQTSTDQVEPLGLLTVEAAFNAPSTPGSQSQTVIVEYRTSKDSLVKYSVLEFVATVISPVIVPKDIDFGTLSDGDPTIRKTFRFPLGESKSGKPSFKVVSQNDFIKVADFKVEKTDLAVDVEISPNSLPVGKLVDYLEFCCSEESLDQLVLESRAHINIDSQITVFPPVLYFGPIAEGEGGVATFAVSAKDSVDCKIIGIELDNACLSEGKSDPNSGSRVINVKPRQDTARGTHIGRIMAKVKIDESLKTVCLPYLFYLK